MHHGIRHYIGLRAIAVVAAAACLAASCANPPATYDNGDVITSEPIQARIAAVPILADTWKILYRSSNRDESAADVSGTVLTPLTAWPRSGPRPLVALTVGTQGLGDQCAPSQQLQDGSEYEAPFIQGFLAKGYSVVVTDYPGLGTPGVHTYVNREVTARAVLDSIRAAQRHPNAGISPDAPVVITGYSQGGGAAAAAAEFAEEYSPELNLVGVAAGAVPADLEAMSDFLDGSLYGAFLGYAVAGLRAGYDLDLSSILSAEGQDILADLEQQCVTDSIAAYPFLGTDALTADGRSISELVADEPAIAEALREQKIGDGLSPDVPVLITHSYLDDVIPYQVGVDLAERWCDQGATVQFAANFAPTHVGGVAPAATLASVFVDARFNGLPPGSTC